MSPGEDTVAKDRPATDVDLRPAWRLGDPAIEADAIAFWRRLAILPTDVAPEERAKELVALVYRRGELIGVSTAVGSSRVDLQACKLEYSIVSPK